MSKLWKMKLVLTACLGLFLAGTAFGQTPTGTVDPMAGYTSTNFTYGAGTVTNGGLVYVSATFTKPAGMELVGLLAEPILPPDWSVDDGLYDDTLPSKAGSTAGTVTSSPEWDEPSSLFLYGFGLLGLTVFEADIKLNFAIYVPPGDTGEKELSIKWYYTTNEEEELTLTSSKQAISDLNVPINPPSGSRTMFRFR